MWLRSGSWHGEVILGHLGGPHVVTGFPKRERGGQDRQRRRGEDRGRGGSNAVAGFDGGRSHGTRDAGLWELEEAWEQILPRASRRIAALFIP